MAGVTIQVVGSSCPNCKNFFSIVQKIVADSNIQAEVEYVDKIEEIIKLGVMTSPALLIDGRVVLTGSAHSEEEIEDFILAIGAGGKISDEKSGSVCSCCAKC